MIYSEVHDFVFSSNQELFPLFFDEDASDRTFFSLRHTIKSLAKIKTVRSGAGNRREWLSLEGPDGKNREIRNLAREIQFVFQTKIDKIEISHLRDGQDLNLYRKTPGQNLFVCLFGASREITFKNRSSGKKSFKAQLSHGDLLFSNAQMSNTHSMGVMPRHNDHVSDSFILLFHCEEPFTSDLPY